MKSNKKVDSNKLTKSVNTAQSLYKELHSNYNSAKTTNQQQTTTKDQAGRAQSSLHNNGLTHKKGLSKGKY